MLKWPGCSRVLIMCITSSAYCMQHVLCAMWYNTRALPCIFRLLCCQAREKEAALVYSTPAGRLHWRVPELHACYCRAVSVCALMLRIPLPAAGRQLTGKKRLLTGLEFKRLNESYNTNQTSALYLLDYKAKNKLSMHAKHAG